MPRKKKTETTNDEPTSILQPESEIEEQETEIAIAVPEPDEQPESSEVLDPESCSRNYLTASLNSTTKSIAGLFETQAQLAGTQIADKVFDSLEEAFVSRLQERLQPFVDTLLPDIKESHAELQQRTAARVERRITAFDRIKQIATLVTDECRMALPSGEPTGNLLGFASWDTNYDRQEND
jgi:hypothetical protein